MTIDPSAFSFHWCHQIQAIRHIPYVWIKSTSFYKQNQQKQLVVMCIFWIIDDVKLFRNLLLHHKPDKWILRKYFSQILHPYHNNIFCWNFQYFQFSILNSRWKNQISWWFIVTPFCVILLFLLLNCFLFYTLKKENLLE